MANTDGLYEEDESTPADDKFYQRTDEFIALANQMADRDQVSHLSAEPGKVSASFMYANARYSVWHAACSYQDGQDFKADRQVILEYYMEQFKLMLEDNLDEYHENFDTYFPKSDQDDEDTQPSFS